VVTARVKQATAPHFDSQLSAVLALEDGTILQGGGFGAPTRVTGEVVFNTGMVGYVESLTDPSYYGQILVQTYPLIGNYGVPKKMDFGPMESNGIQVKGYAITDLCKTPSHWSSVKSLSDWLAEQRKPGIFGIDTRELTKRLRTKGTMLGILEVSEEEPDTERISQEIKHIEDPNQSDLVREVSVKRSTTCGDSLGPAIALIDCGVKYGIIRSLLDKGCRVTRFPYDSSESEILKSHPDGIVVSNGPGDPKLCKATIKVLHGLIESGTPLLGICLGLQLIALAEGADTYKMKFGHRGQNHPCLDLRSGKAWITSQNHGYAVDDASLSGTQFATSLNHINDGTVEGIQHQSYPVHAVQFHPEASPGPTEAGAIFNEFLGDVQRFRG
jgi:carbamoyl-phosphate synthase small subunit